MTMMMTIIIIIIIMITTTTSIIIITLISITFIVVVDGYQNDADSTSHRKTAGFMTGKVPGNCI